MRGIGDVIVGYAWKQLPGRTRARLSESFLEWYRRAGLAIPKNAVTVFADHPKLRSRFQAQIASERSPVSERDLPAYSLVCTVYNEARTVVSWLDSVRSQTVLPAELIVVDGGSTDGTSALIEQWYDRIRSEVGHEDPSARANRVPLVKVIRRSRCNIAEGRNAGIDGANEAIVIFSDAGCELDREWAHRLLEPFVGAGRRGDAEPEIGFVMGWYRPLVRTSLASQAQHFILPRLDDIDPATFLPSARSLAVTRENLRRVGGFPTHLSDAGEDSLFGISLKSLIAGGAFAPEAIVYWRIPQSVPALFRTMFRYARGDGEGGRVSWAYYLNLLRGMMGIAVELLLGGILFISGRRHGVGLLTVFGVCLLLSFCFRFWRLISAYQPPGEASWSVSARLWRAIAVATMVVAQSLGFLCGLNNRRVVEQRRLVAGVSRHVILIVPEAPIRSESGSSIDRSAAEVMRFIAADLGVTAVYVTAPRSDAVIIEHPRLNVYQRSGFDFPRWCASIGEVLKKHGVEVGVEDRVGDSLSGYIRAQATGWGAVVGREGKT